MKKIKIFIQDVHGELKKVSWPTRQDVKDSTIVVIISAFFLALFVGAVDFVLKIIMAILIR